MLKNIKLRTAHCILNGNVAVRVMQPTISKIRNLSHTRRLRIFVVVSVHSIRRPNLAAQVIPFDRPVASFTQQLLRYQGAPRKGVAVLGTFVQERPCIEFTESVVMLLTLHQKRRGCVLLQDRVDDVFGPFSATKPLRS